MNRYHRFEKINQTEFGEYGNCRSACFATLLGLNINNVPNFENGRDYLSLHAFQERIDIWLSSQGVSCWIFDIWAGWKEYIHPDQYFMAIIPSSLKGDYAHCVIYKGIELFHDPMVGNNTSKEINQICLFVPLRLDISKQGIYTND